LAEAEARQHAERALGRVHSLTHGAIDRLRLSVGNDEVGGDSSTGAARASRTRSRSAGGSLILPGLPGDGKAIGAAPVAPGGVETGVIGQHAPEGPNQAELLRKFEYELEFQLELQRQNKAIVARRNVGGGGGGGNGGGGGGSGGGALLGHGLGSIGSSTHLLAKTHELPGLSERYRNVDGGGVSHGMSATPLKSDVDGAGIARSPSATRSGSGLLGGAGSNAAPGGAGNPGEQRLSDVHLRLYPSLRFRELVNVCSRLAGIREACMSEMQRVAPPGARVVPKDNRQQDQDQERDGGDEGNNGEDALSPESTRKLAGLCDLLHSVTIRTCAELSALAAEFPTRPFFFGGVQYRDKIVHDVAVLAAARLLSVERASMVARALENVPSGSEASRHYDDEMAMLTAREDGAADR
jgi:hypothetical protein